MRHTRLLFDVSLLLVLLSCLPQDLGASAFPALANVTDLDIAALDRASACGCLCVLSARACACVCVCVCVFVFKCFHHYY